MTVIDSETSDTGSARSTSATTVWARRGLLALAALGVSYVALLWASSRFLDPVDLADWIEPRLAAAVNRDVEVGEATVRILPFEVRLLDVAVSDPTGLARELAHVGSVAMRLELLPLLRREVRVARVTLDGPLLDLRVGPDGMSNFGDLSPQQREAPAEGDAPLALDLRTMSVRDGRLRYSGGVDSWFWTMYMLFTIFPLAYPG